MLKENAKKMHIHLQHKNEAKRLLRAIQEHMRRRFILLPEHLGLLRCFEYDGQINGKRVRRISIFSPNKAREKKLLIKPGKTWSSIPSCCSTRDTLTVRGKPTWLTRELSDLLTITTFDV